MPDYILTLIWNEINKCEFVEEKKLLVSKYIEELEEIHDDMVLNSWEYE